MHGHLKSPFEGIKDHHQHFRLVSFLVNNIELHLYQLVSFYDKPRVQKVESIQRKCYQGKPWMFKCILLSFPGNFMAILQRLTRNILQNRRNQLKHFIHVHSLNDMTIKLKLMVDVGKYIYPHNKCLAERIGF